MEDAKTIINAPSCGSIPSQGGLRYQIKYWGLLTGLYLVLVFRLPIRDQLILIENVLVNRVAPSSFLNFHHTLAGYWTLYIGLLISGWFVIKALCLTNQEIGWLRPANVAKATGLPLVFACAYWVFLECLGFYRVIVFNWLLSFADAHRLLWLWPKYLAISFTLQGDIYAVSLQLGKMMVGPLVEEIVFRGIFWGALKRHFKTGTVIIITSFLFAMAHFGLNDWLTLVHPQLLLNNSPLISVSMFQYILAGMIYGWLRSRYGNLWAPTVFHICYNLMKLCLFANLIVHWPLKH